MRQVDLICLVCRVYLVRLVQAKNQTDHIKKRNTLGLARILRE
jgi:hypothetical protein